MKSARRPLTDVMRSAHLRLGVSAVIAAGMVLTILSFLTLRTYVEQNLTLVARSISYAAEAATVFNDPASATEVLTLIAAQEGLQSADISRTDGKTIAKYARQNSTDLSAGIAKFGTYLFPLEVSAQITNQDLAYGRVTVRGNGGVYLMYLLKALTAVVACMTVIAWWVSRLSRRIECEIVGPLNSLALLTRTARQRRELGLRAEPAAVKEIHTLGEDFNALLAEIQARESELLTESNNLKTANESLSWQALHDALTGLPNRTSFMQHASRAIIACRERESAMAILYVDSDNFKSINDSLGHAAGDDVLVEVARRIRSLMREGDLVARLGGDEFAVLLAPIRGVDDAARIGSEIASALRAQVRSQRLGDIDTSASVGVAVFPAHGATVDTLLLAADAAMYRAKNLQPGSCRMFDAALDDSVVAAAA
jgi:diguanylate cyclase (GGDEF)-like protein